MLLPLFANLQKNILFKWDEFKENVCLKFISLFQSEIKSAFNQLQFWLNFTALDPRKLPETIPDVESCGIEEINELVNFYGADKKDAFKGENVLRKADLDKITTLAEFEGFKQTVRKTQIIQRNDRCKNNQINRPRKNKTFMKTKTTVYTFNVILQCRCCISRTIL